MHRSILLALSILLLFNNLSYSAVESPSPIIPSPKKVYWEKIRPSPYTMVIRSKRYGEFNFTQEADKALDEYKMLCKITGYSMEIPCVALVKPVRDKVSNGLNKKQEVIDVIYPPRKNILPINIDIDKIYEYNRENPSLIEELKKPFLKPEDRDQIVLRIIANSISHPLGRLSIVEKGNKMVILAQVLNQRVFIPREFIEIPSVKEILMRKDWYIIVTPNTCYWSEYFINYIEMESKKRDAELKIPIHLHPWQQMQWLMETPEKYWLSEYKIHLIPSGGDIEFFKSRYPDSKLYIIVGKDIYSEELIWAVYDDITSLEGEMKNLELLKDDKNEAKELFKRMSKMQGVVYMYHKAKDKGLVIDEEIDNLLILNKRQIFILEEIEDYKKEYPWRLLNTSFLIPILNGQLGPKGWRVVPNKKEELGYNLNRREFYYREGVTSRMDMFLFIIFNLCYIEADSLASGLNKEVYTVGLLKDICAELDYLCIKYYHLEGFRKHMEYLSNIIRLNIWEREKRVLIAKEQANNGRHYLDRYNLGYYVDKDDIKAISNITFQVMPEAPPQTSPNITFPESVGVLELEDLVKRLSKKHNIKNVEEFSMEFEEQLVLAILRRILESADFS